MKSEDDHKSSVGVYEFFLGEELLLFSNRNRNLYWLNTTAAFIWCHHAEGFSIQKTIGALANAFGIPTKKAKANVLASLSQWYQLGLLGTSSVLPNPPSQRKDTESIAPTDCHRRAPPIDSAIEHRYHLAGTYFQVRFATPEIQLAVHPLFAHLEANPNTPTDEVFDVTKTSGGFLLSRNSAPLTWCKDLCGLGPLVHGELLATACKSADCLAIIHAAAVTKDNHAILFPGDSGSGKSTLAAALMTAGYGYLSDEIAPLTHGSYHITPVPLSIGLKEGAWPVLSPFHPALKRLPIHQRQDGKKIRYLPPSHTLNQTAPGYPVKQIIFPRYRGNITTSIQPISHAEALYRISEGGYSVNGYLNAATVSELIHWISGIECFEICYSSLPEALNHIRDIIIDN